MAYTNAEGSSRKKKTPKAPVYKARVIKQDNSAKVLKMSNKARRAT
jgi:hypothetical protein